MNEDNPLKAECVSSMHIGIVLTVPAGEDRRSWGEQALIHAAQRMGIPTPFPLSITMPCGHQVTYNSMDEIPLEDTHCACDDDHYLVKWQEA